MSNSLSSDDLSRCSQGHDLNVTTMTMNISSFSTSRVNYTVHYFYSLNEPCLKIVFIIMCLVVFLACVVGNLIVLLVTARNLRMQTRTNILLANLAVADMCVGIFCVIPNMVNYLSLQWHLGRVVCKLYQFVESLSFTASMLLLEVIAVERYIAINHPLKAKSLFTRKKMFLAQFSVWFVSSVYNIPFLFIYDTIETCENNVTSSFCFTPMSFNEEVFYIFTFVVWYLIPLFIMGVMYAAIANTLWRSSLPLTGNSSRANVSRTSSSQSGGTDEPANGRIPVNVRMSLGLSQSNNLTETSVACSCSSEVNSSPKFNRSEQTTPVKMNNDFCTVLFKKQQQACGRTIENVQFRSSFKDNGIRNKEPFGNRSPGSADLKVPYYSFPSCSDNDPHFSLNRKNSLKRETSLGDNGSTNSRTSLVGDFRHCRSPNQTPPPNQSSLSPSTHRISLQRTSRRRVVKLLMVVLLTFAVLVLPNHIRMMLVYFHPFDIRWASSSAPVCHTLMYLNSALNPLLYSFFSESFRRSLKELVYCCRSRRPRA